MFDKDALLQTLAAHGPVARVVIADYQGSSPRETGAAMLVWQEGQSGTIGGGALEYHALQVAREMLAKGKAKQFERIPLGPAMGQCCGGNVALLTEIYRPDHPPAGDVIARPVQDAPLDAPIPLNVKKLLTCARNSGQITKSRLIQGWFIESIAQPQRHIWVWGAGHVGRAAVSILAPLPHTALTWVDYHSSRFPDDVPDPIMPAPITRLHHENPASLVPYAPPAALHFIMTYSHSLDFELCHRLLGHHFGCLGMIGSHSKAARFKSRLAGLGHSPAQLARLICPIGDKEFGKHPQEIAVAIAAFCLTYHKTAHLTQTGTSP